MDQNANRWVVVLFSAVCGVALFLKLHARGAAPPAQARASSTPPTLEVVFASSDGKKEWVDDAIRAFNAQKLEVQGQRVVVKAQHMRSGESRQAILAGREKPTIWGPAGKSWIELINQDWQLKERSPFVAEVRDTVNTALVIATWEPMARALGWPDKPIGWADLHRVTADPRGWGAFGHPEWGAFKFGHSHPDYSNSAMLSVLSLIHAAAGKTSRLTAEDMKNPRVIDWVRDIERAVVHYGESSSWLTEKLCQRGPAYLSAVTLYESSVVKANDKCRDKPFPLVALYPKEGTYWETHPAGIVQAAWVSEAQKEGARLFLDFLVAPAQQAKAPRFGFRPALAGVPLSAPLDVAHGVRPDAPRTELEYVSEDLFHRANGLWHAVKKKATVWLLLDTSSSMQGEPLEAAKQGAMRFLAQMEPDDVVQVVSFNSALVPLGTPGRVREVGETLSNKVGGLYAEGGTSLYDALLLAMDELELARWKDKGERQYGIVVLSDGRDTSSRRPLADVIAHLPGVEASDGTRLFTIAYGAEADATFLQQLAERSNAVALKGGSADIERLYHQLAAYF
jgi:Ca-activated chloride channel homolog